MGSLLTLIQPGNVLSSLLHLLNRIIVSLLSYEPVPNQNFPVTCHQRHIWTQCQRLASLQEDLVQEKEAKVLYLVLLWILHIVSGLKLIPEVITDMLLKFVPETTGF